MKTAKNTFFFFFFLQRLSRIGIKVLGNVLAGFKKVHLGDQLVDKGKIVEADVIAHVKPKVDGDHFSFFVFLLAHLMKVQRGQVQKLSGSHDDLDGTDLLLEFHDDQIGRKKKKKRKTNSMEKRKLLVIRMIRIDRDPRNFRRWLVFNNIKLFWVCDARSVPFHHGKKKKKTDQTKIARKWPWCKVSRTMQSDQWEGAM